MAAVVLLAAGCSSRDVPTGSLTSTEESGEGDTTCVSLSPVHDATVFSRPGYEAMLYGHREFLCSMAWTFDGEFAIYRTYFDFGIKQAIPVGSTIESANLRLFHSSLNSDETQSGANASSMNLVAEAWTEDNLTWNAQVDFQVGPKIGEVPQSVAPEQDYVIELTAGVQELLDGPWTSFVIRLDTEETYRRLFFGSRESDFVDERPVLDVCYSI